MPCRPAYKTAQTTQCLWITDEVLADAFNRFIRVFNAHRHKRGRRYGSNVPGPLEAHRRLAKRRMGMSSMGAGVQPGAADIGALFGFGGYGARVFDPARDLKWKPPGIEKEKRDEHWLFPKSERRRQKERDERWGPPLEPQPSHDPRAVEISIAKSKTTFSELLRTKVHRQFIEEHDLHDLVQFLQSASDEPGARNAARLCRHLSPLRMSRAAAQSLATMLLEKVRLETLQESETFDALSWLITNPCVEPNDIIPLLDALPPGLAFRSGCANVLRTLFNRIVGRENRVDELPVPIQHWLDCLRQCRHLQMPQDRDSTWHAIHDILASRALSLSVISRHLSLLTELQLCRIVLQHWVPQWSAIRSSDLIENTTFPDGKFFDFRQPKVVDAGSMLAAFDAEHPETQASIHDPSPVVDLLALLQEHGVPFVEPTHEVFDVLMHQPASEGYKLHDTFSTIAQHPTLGVPGGLAGRLINYLLASNTRGHVRLAYRVFEYNKSVELIECYNLPLRMIKTGEVHSAVVWDVLGRQSGGEIVDMSGREHRKNSLQPGHIDLIHLAAHQFSLSPHTTDRVARRRVWECYRFLRDRNAPINSMITKALVHAGIIRYLENFQRPANAAVSYILGLVKTYEGEDAAEKLDITLWNLWTNSGYVARRRQHIREEMAKTLDAIRSASPGDLPNQVREARYRVKAWIKTSPRFRKAMADTTEFQTGEIVGPYTHSTHLYRNDANSFGAEPDAVVQPNSYSGIASTETPYVFVPSANAFEAKPALDDAFASGVDVLEADDTLGNHERDPIFHSAEAAYPKIELEHDANFNPIVPTSCKVETATQAMANARQRASQVQRQSYLPDTNTRQDSAEPRHSVSEVQETFQNSQAAAISASVPFVANASTTESASGSLDEADVDFVTALEQERLGQSKDRTKPTQWLVGSLPDPEPPGPFRSPTVSEAGSQELLERVRATDLIHHQREPKGDWTTSETASVWDPASIALGDEIFAEEPDDLLNDVSSKHIARDDIEARKWRVSDAKWSWRRRTLEKSPARRRLIDGGGGSIREVSEDGVRFKMSIA